MAAPAFLSGLLERLGPLLERLPFLPKAARPAPEEPFHELEDEGPEGEESFSPNALPSKSAPGRPRLDLGALVGDLLHRPLFLVSSSLLVLLCVAILAVSLIAGAPPPAGPPLAGRGPSTPEGRAAASRLLLPPDPVLSLEPPMEREPRIPYTDEDLRRLAPVEGREDLGALRERNDRAMDAVFGVLP